MVSLAAVKSAQASRIRDALSSFESRRRLARMVAKVAKVAKAANVAVCQVRSEDVRRATVV